MTLWLIALGALFFGCVCVALIERRIDPGQIKTALIHTLVVFFAFVGGVGALVAFNLFVLDLIDPFFENTGWHVFRILYWPAGFLAFLPLLFGGLLVLMAVVRGHARRVLFSVLLLLASLAAFELTALVDDRPFALIIVQLLVFTLFAALVGRSR